MAEDTEWLKSGSLEKTQFFSILARVTFYLRPDKRQVVLYETLHKNIYTDSTIQK